MKLTYLWQVRHYKPEYDIEDFRRVNCLEDIDPRKILKIMKALYPLWLQENYPDLFNIYDSENETTY